jgi:hypothetical protein
VESPPGLEDRALPSTLTVTNLNDSGCGSLGYELGRAQDGDTVAFRSGLHGTLTLASGELQVSQSVTIQGPGAGLLSVSGNHASRVLEVLPGAEASVSGLTVTGGVANAPGSPTLVGLGGGIFVDRGAALTLTDAVVTGNTANAASASFSSTSPAVLGGGGIYNAGTLTLSGDVITGNTANAGPNVIAFGWSTGPTATWCSDRPRLPPVGPQARGGGRAPARGPARGQTAAPARELPARCSPAQAGPGRKPWAPRG